LYYKNEFQQYLDKYAFIKRKTRFWKVPRHTNSYVSNKWPLKFWKVPRHTNSYVSNKWPLKYSLKFPTLVQYFFVLGNSIFLHFRSVSNKLIKVI
ncbi:hypothetical protein T07_12505, partial [Trichinella nelsoni]